MLLFEERCLDKERSFRNDPPPEVHDDLVWAWEIHPGPISRWQLPIRRDVRTWDIDRPDDWTRLVETYPKVATRPHDGWELPGPNQHVYTGLPRLVHNGLQRLLSVPNQDVDAGLQRLLAVPNQHAARSSVDRHVLPDWEAVAQDFDGVHLSWAGFLTTEGYVSDLSVGGVTMLRYWSSERMLWLADVFGDPVPLVAPALSGRVNDDRGIDVSQDEGRKVRDLKLLTSWLGRSA